MPEEDQFAFWGASVRQAFTTVAVDRPGHVRGFDSRIVATHVGPLRVAWIASQPQCVTRLADHVSSDPGDVVFVNLPLTAGTTASQGGRTAELAPGDFTVIDSLRPFALNFQTRFEQVSVTIPRELLAGALQARPDVTAVRIDGRKGAGALAASAIRTLPAAGPIGDREQGARVAAHVVGLIDLALAAVPSGRRGLPRETLLAAALDEIDRSLGDPELTPAHVAGRIAVSTRYLHQLFAEHGASFSQTLRHRRLARCLADLRDPAKSHWSVSLIAAENGFRDPSYMARAFRQRYEVTPRAVRRPRPQPTSS